MPFLSIVIPAYNEERRLPVTLAAIKKYLNSQPYDAEVLVIDDGSTDKTLQVADSLTAGFPNLRIVSNTQNKGKGGVVRQGMLLAAGEYRLFADADNSTPIEQLDILLKCVPEYEVVIGSRYLAKGSIKVKQPLARRLVSRGGNLAIQSLLLPGIRDTQCGFKLFSAAAAQAIFSRQTLTGWAFDLEILTIALAQGYKVHEVPVAWYDDKESNLRATRDSAKFFKGLLEVRRRRQAGAYR